MNAFRLKEMNNIRYLLHHMDAAGCMCTQVVVSKV